MQVCKVHNVPKKIVRAARAPHQTRNLKGGRNEVLRTFRCATSRGAACTHWLATADLVLPIG